MRVTLESLSKALLAGPRPKTPTTIRTITTTLLQQYARYSGNQKAEDLGNLSWLTPDSLTAPNKAVRLRPWPGGSEKGAVLEASTRSRMLQNCRSALDALDRSCPPGLHEELRRGWRTQRELEGQGHCEGDTGHTTGSRDGQPLVTLAGRFRAPKI